MSLKQKIKDKVKEIIDAKFEITDVNTVPTIDDSRLTFGNKGLRFKATVLFIDLRGSTKLLNSHNKRTVAKIHMSYYHAIVKVADDNGGEIRSFNGDSLLVFFQGNTKDSLSNAVKTAMHMKYILSHEDGIKPKIKKYTEIDFGIGIDHGEILCTKVGIGGNSHMKDIFWIGNAVNKSTRLGDSSQSPRAITISSHVYDNLNHNVKYHKKKDYWGNDIEVNMWEQKTFKYNDAWENCYDTSYHWTIS